VSFLNGKQLDALPQLLQLKKVQVISSAQQTVEIAAVLVRPHLQRHVTQAKRRLLEYFTIRTAENVQPIENVSVCRDPKDNYLLETAIAGNADLIVTGDKDLPVLHPFRGIRIISYTEFEQSLSEL